jgi:hypothetical protein
MVIIKDNNNNKCWGGCSRETGTLIHCRWECKLVQPCKNHYGNSSKNKR